MTQKNNSKKIFNCRPIMFLFFMFAFGCIFANFYQKQSVFYVILLILIIILLIFTAFYFKKFVLSLLCLLTLFLGAGYFGVCLKHFDNTVVYAEAVEIKGTIYKVGSQKSCKQIIYLTDSSIDDCPMNANIMIQVYDNLNVFEYNDIGNVIIFEQELQVLDLYEFDDEMASSFLYQNNLKYYADVNTQNITLLEHKDYFSQKIKDLIKQNLSLGLNNENASLAFSALFGDKTELSSDISTAFSTSGVSHLIAVSGLHVGFIVAILILLLNLLRIKKLPQIIIVFVILMFYAYICNFSPSIIRAMIMAMCLMMAPIFKRDYDIVSAISLAGLITLVINPINVFDVGWLLSFGCVFGIAYFTKPFKYIFDKMGLNKMSSSIAISLSAQISILFVSALVFEQVQTLSLLSNIVIIPLFTLAFSFIFIIVILTLIIPYISYVLCLINPVFSVIIIVTNLIASIPFAVLSTNVINYFSVIIYFAMLTLISRFCLIERSVKITLISIFATILVVNSTILML